MSTTAQKLAQAKNDLDSILNSEDIESGEHLITAIDEHTKNLNAYQMLSEGTSEPAMALVGTLEKLLPVRKLYEEVLNLQAALLSEESAAVVTIDATISATGVALSVLETDGNPLLLLKRQKLSVLLASLLADLLQSVAECSAAVDAKEGTLIEMDVYGEGNTQPAAALRNELSELKEILVVQRDLNRLDVHLTAQNIHSVSFGSARYVELSALLSTTDRSLEDEAMAAFAECEKALPEKQAQLNDLVAAKKGSFKPAIALRTTLRRLKRIFDLNAELDLEISTGTVVSVVDPPDEAAAAAELGRTHAPAAQFSAVLGDEGMDSAELCLRAIAEKDAVLSALGVVEKGATKPAMASVAGLCNALPVHEELLAVSNDPTVALLTPVPVAKSSLAIDVGSPWDDVASPRSRESKPSKEALAPACPPMVIDNAAKLQPVAEEGDIFHGAQAPHTFPDCAERSLMTLHLHFKKEADALTAAKTSTKTRPSVTPRLLQLVNALKAQLSTEELTTPSVTEQLKLIEAQLDGGTVETLVNETWMLLKSIQPIDVALMLDLLRKTDEAAKRIRDKDIVLLLGGTGSGKSTTIHWLAGSTMAKTLVDGMKHIAPTQIKRKDLLEVTSSPHPRSETRCIRDIDLDQEGLILCDSPGFLDTEGVEVDITNGVGVVNAVRMCRSVKPLVLMSRESIGDRLDGVIKLARILMMFIPDIQQHLHAFSYAFTKYHPDDVDDILPKLDHFHKNPHQNQQGDVAFMALLGDMVQKIDKKLQVIHLLTDSPSSFLDTLRSTAEITEPADVFNYFASQESYYKLKDQLNKHQASVHRCLRRMDMDLLRLKMNELALLESGLCFDPCIKVYSECVGEVTRCIDDLLALANERLDSAMEDQNASVAEDFGHCVDAMHKLCLLERVRAVHYRAMSNLKELTDNKLQNAQQSLLVGVKAYIVQASTGGSATVVSDTHDKRDSTQYYPSWSAFTPSIDTVANRLNKMRTIVDTCARVHAAAEAESSELQEGLTRQYGEACDYLSDLVTLSREIAHRSIPDHALPVFVCEMDRLKAMLGCVGDHMDVGHLHGFYKGLQEQLQVYWASSLQRALEMLTSNDSLEAVEILMLHEILEMFDSSANQEGLSTHTGDEAAPRENRNKIIDSIVNSYIARICSRVLSAEDVLPSFADIHRDVALIDSVRVLPEVVHSSGALYQELTDFVRHKVGSLKESLMLELVKFKSHVKPGTKFNFARFVSGLVDLESASCFLGHPSGVLVSEFVDVTTAIVEFHTDLQCFIVSNKLKVTDYAKLATINNWLDILSGLSACHAVIPECKALADAIHEAVHANVIELLSAASKQFLIDSVSPDEIKSALLFLSACKASNLKATLPAIETLEICVRTFITEYFAGLEARWNRNLKCFVGEAQLTPKELSAAADELQNVSREVRNLFQGFIFEPFEDFYTEIFDSTPKRIFSGWYDAALPTIAAQLLTSAKATGDVVVSKDELFYNLLVAQALRKLDDFAHQMSPTFGELVVMYEAAIANAYKDVVQALKLAAFTHRYDDFKEALGRFDSQSPEGAKDLTDIMAELVASVSTSVNELSAEMLASKFEDTRSFSDFTKRLLTVTTDFSKIKTLIPAEMQVAGPLQLAQVESDMFAWLLKELQKINEHLTSNDFQRCEIVLARSREMAGSIEETLAKVGAYDRNKLKAFLGAIVEKQKAVQLKVFKEVERHGKQELTRYFDDPPADFFMRLQAAANQSADPIYAQGEAVLSDKIAQSVFAVLEELKDADHELISATIKDIASCAKFLPAKVVGVYEERVKDFEESTKAARDKEDREMAEHCAHNRFYDIVDELIRSYDTKQISRVQKCQTHLTRMIGQACTRFHSDLAKGHLQTVLETLPVSWQEWQFYVTALSGLTVHSNLHKFFSSFDIRKEQSQSNKLCNEMTTAVRSEIVKITREMASAEGWRAQEKKIGHLIYFLEFKLLDIVRPRKSWDCLYNCLIQKHPILEENLKNAILLVATSFKANTELFREKVVAENSAELRVAMETAIESSAFFTRLLDFSKTPHCKRELPGLAVALSECMQYREMRSELGMSILQWTDTLNQPFLNNPSTGTENVLDRNAFYLTLFMFYKRLKDLKALSAHIDEGVVNVNKVDEQVVKHIQEKLREVSVHVLGLLHRMPTDDASLNAGFNIWNDNFRSFIENFNEPNLKAIATGFREDVREKLRAKIVAIVDRVQGETDLEKIIAALITVKSIILAAPTFKTEIDKLLNEYLTKLKNAEDGMIRIGLLGVRLNKHTNSEVAQRIINDHPTFEGYALYLRNEKTLRFTVHDVLKNLTSMGAPINKPKLLQHYTEFDNEYWALVQAGLLDRLAKQNEIVQSAIKLANKSTSSPEERIEKVRILMAHILAWWTLSHAKDYVEAMEKKEAAEECESKEAPALTVSVEGIAEDPTTAAAPVPISSSTASSDKNYLKQPHAAQVISIFRLLGVDADASNDAQTGMANHLVQLGTGEGKSVVLAVSCTVLSLMGYEVYCGCYSEYLSSRDSEAFENVFQAFAIARFVHYGTFNKLCENFINKFGDVRTLAEVALKGQSVADACARPSARGKILLIDEVDVFFNKEFYGNVYKPMTKLVDPAITALITHLWTNRVTPQQLRYQVVCKSPVYQSVVKAFPGWEELLDESLKKLLGDLKTFESQEYVVLNGRIGYKDQDMISFDVVDGYKTLFAYFKEHGLRTVTQSTLDAKIALYIDCGNFSYAEIPKEYLHVIGVSGTLEALSAPKKKLLADAYKIAKHTFTPSVYGANKLDFAGDSISGVIIEPAAGYFNEIRKEINTRLRSLVDKTATEIRAVLVFFASKTKLMDFYNSPQMRDKKSQVRIIHEEVAPANKDVIIGKAVTSGSITLLTSEFGRGTDFICYDGHLIQAGGVHVLQTFVSDEVSEETQIMGRTARQGNNGSYSMVLLEGDLEKYGIQPATVVTMKATNSIYKTINEHRNLYYNVQYPKDTLYVEDIKKDHLLSTQFLTALTAGNLPEVKKFLLEQNKSNWRSEEVEVCRTICLMDATGSMSGLLQEAKQKVRNMFENAHVILQQEGYDAAFELQFAVYRNYNCTQDMLLQHSSWASEPGSLKAFIDSIDVAGGMGNEAIEIGLWHVNKEITTGKVSQVILIGDMPANTLEDVTDNRNSENGGEPYWSQTPFRTPTHYQAELNKIIAQKIPVHAFYLGTQARSQFMQIAQSTGGQCQELDLSVGAKDDLTALITTSVLNQIGGVRDGVDHGAILINAYRAKFTKGYVAADKHNTAEEKVRG